MRYTKDENTILAGNLPTGGDVTIKIINMDTDDLLTLDTDACTESDNIPGLFKFDTVNITDDRTDMISCLYEMSDGTKTFRGKFILSGYVNTASLTQEQTDQLMSMVNYDDAALKQLAYAILGSL